MRFIYGVSVYLERYTYIGIFIAVALSGYLIPIPEEVTLLLVGYVAAYLSLNIYLVMALAALGIMAGDNILFWLSYSKGSAFIKKLRAGITKDRLQKYRKLMKRHMGKAIFTLRFVAGLRFFAPLLAGSLRVKWRRFFIYNLLALLIYVPLVIFLGYHFHNKLAMIISEVEIARHIVFAIVLALSGYLIIYLRKKA